MTENWEGDQVNGSEIIISMNVQWKTRLRKILLWRKIHFVWWWDIMSICINENTSNEGHLQVKTILIKASWKN